MKKTAIALFLLVPMLLSAQQRKQAYNYRPAPEKGELMCISGLAMIALSYTLQYTDVNQNIAKTVGYAGGAMVSAGVVIDIGGRGKTNRGRVKLWKRK